MSPASITIEAVFEDGILRPVEPLPLVSQQRVTITIQLPSVSAVWPEDVAAIYRELADEDRHLAAMMWNTVNETWPASE